MITDTFTYTHLSRQTIGGSRFYVTPDNRALPSVTTILDRTKDKTALFEWRKRVGEQEATRVAKEASGRGTSMHKHLENWLLGRPEVVGTNLVHQQAAKMAKVIIESALKPKLTAAWGNEISIYYPELYAGTMDLAGVWDGKAAVLDFKQSNRPKKREWIEDYFCQIAAYSAAHNEIYGTDIRHGVVLVCTQDLQYQQFEISGGEFDHYTNMWWNRVDQYYRDHHN